VPTPFLAADIDKIDQMIELNVIALGRLTYAVMPAFVERAKGAVINISSALGIAPELLNGVYGGTKAFILAFGFSLHKEFSGRGIRIQTVVPGVFVPADVAADAFYAKGSNGAARLFEILWLIEDRDSRESMRAAVPIWISSLSAHKCDWSAIAVSCPECLRVFFPPVGRGKGSTLSTSCPHCFYPVQLEIVTQPNQMDTTSFGADRSTSSGIQVAVAIDLDIESMSELVGQ
jgi:short chain dehydrogenase